MHDELTSNKYPPMASIVRREASARGEPGQGVSSEICTHYLCVPGFNGGKRLLHCGGKCTMLTEQTMVRLPLLSGGIAQRQLLPFTEAL